MTYPVDVENVYEPVAARAGKQLTVGAGGCVLEAQHFGVVCLNLADFCHCRRIMDSYVTLKKGFFSN